MRRKRSNRIAKRMLSVITALALFSGSFPMTEISEKLNIFSAALVAHAVDDYSKNPTFFSAQNIIDYSKAYRAYPQNHYDDDIIVNRSDDLDETSLEGFLSLGTAEYPFAGTITFNATSTHDINIDTAFFDYVYDYVLIDGGIDAGVEKYMTIRPLKSNSDALLANHVLHDDGSVTGAVYGTGAGQKSPATWTIETAAYEGTEHTHGSLIGEMGESAECTVNLINDYSSAVENNIGSGESAFTDTGAVCGVMQAGSKLTIASVTGSAAARVTSSGGNAGGLVGTMHSGSTLTISGSSSDYVSNTSAITAVSGYAGGIVGYNDQAAVSGGYAAVKNTITGSSGAGGLYGYYKPVMTDSAYTLSLDSYSIGSGTGTNDRCKVSSPVGAGGFFGVLENPGGTVTLTGTSAHSIYAMGEDNSTIFGGVIGSYKAASLDDTLSVAGASGSVLTVNTNKSGNLSYYGGIIGKIDGAYFAGISDVNVNASGANDEFFGGAAACVDTGYVYVNDLTLTASSYSGGAIVGHTAYGVVHIAGTTNLAAASSDAGNDYGQIVGYRDSALVFAESGWDLIRNSALTVEADDIGSWGEVVRFKASDFTIGSVLSTYYVPSDTTPYHYATLSGASFSGSKIALSSKSTFAAAALNMQLNGGEDTDVLRFSDKTNSKYETLKTKSITMTASIDLSHTGMTGLTRDNGIRVQYAGAEFDGGSASNKLTLAIGEGYEGTDTTSPDSAGKGMIYRHNYNGLFGETSENFTIKNVTISGKVHTNDKIGGTNTFYVGTVAGNAAKQFNANAVIVDSGTSVKYAANTAEKDTLYVGGLVGKMSAPGTSTIGRATASGTLDSTFSASVSGSAAVGAVHVGGVCGYVGAGGTVNVHDIKITNEVSNGSARDTQTIGGLFATVAGGTLDLNGVETNALTVKGKMSSGGSMGGLLGYNWDGVTAAFDNIDVTDCTLNNDSSSGNQAALVYTGSGYWKFKDTAIAGLTLTGSAASSLGMLVNKAYSARNAMYLELPSGFTYTITGVTGTAPSIYDEIAVYTVMPDNTIEANGNSVISINTNGTTRYGTMTASDDTNTDNTKVHMTSGKCNTYQNQVTSTGFSKYNPNSRYYYNVDNYIGKSNSGAAALYLWSVYQYAHSTIRSDIATTAPASTFSGTLDLDGYSYYPADVSVAVNIQGNVTLCNKAIEDTEAASSGGNDSFARTTLNSVNQTQHYLMHAGLFRNVSGTININGAFSINGTVPDTGAYCGALICGTIGGNAENDAAVRSDNTGAGISLAGIKVHNKDAAYSPLLINNASTNVVLDIYNVTASGYSANDEIATSLIGVVGSDTAEKIQVTFNGIKLDGRKPDNSTETGLTAVYGTSHSLFTRATLLESLTYASGSGSFGIYNYEHSEDWAGSPDRAVTYGIEISDDNSVNKGKEYYYYKNFGQADYFTNPSQDSTTANRTEKYSFAGFRPYVAVWGTGIGSSSTKHQLDVNHSAATFGGCGTYNHPFTLAATDSDKSGGLVTIARLITGKNLPESGYTIDLPDDISTPSKWCREQEECSTYTFNGTLFKHSSDSSKDKSMADVRKYLAGAYYYLSTDIEIEANSGFNGLGNSSNDYAVFRGVIAGNGRTVLNKTDSPLIYASNGSVIRKLTVTVQNTNPINLYTTESSQTFAKTGGCPAYGAIIGRVFGGDNIIDQVSVNLSSANLSCNYLSYAGGYIGVIVDGGVFFRNMDNDHVAQANRAGFGTSGIFAPDDTGHLYCNPIIGRVLNGYAVTEGSTYAPTDSTATMKNGTKNYAIADIVKNDKLTVANTMTVGSAQQWFVLSLIVNDGSSLYLGPYKAVHRGTYTAVGNDADTPTTDDANDVIGTSGVPYIFQEYASGTWTNNSTGYTLILPENGVWRLPDGYRGIGGLNNTTGANNSSCNIKIAGITGNNTQITLNMKYQSYHVISNGTKYDNYTPGDYGFGFFNVFSPSANNINVSNFILSGTVITETYNESGIVFYNYGNAAAMSDITRTANRGRLHTGLFAGLKSDTSNKLVLNNVSLSTATVESDRRAGGFIGSAANVTLSKCSADTIKVIGRADTGGLFGYTESGVSILGDDTIENGKTKKTTVLIDIINQKAKGTKYMGNQSRSTSMGGIVGGNAGNLTINNINIQKANGKDGVVRYTNVDGNDDMATVGGFIGASSSGTISISQCVLGNISVQGNSARTGGIMGSAWAGSISINNVEMDGLNGTQKNSIESDSKHALGGMVGFAQANLTIEDITLKNYIISKKFTTLNDDTSNYIGGCVGVLYNNKTLYLKNFSIENCEFAGEAQGSATTDGAGRTGGIVGRIWSNGTIYGYNIAENNIKIDNLANQAKYQGDLICISDGTVKIQIVGFSRQNTPTDKLINNSATYTESTKYIIFSDYDGTGIDGTGNQTLPKTGGTTVTDMVADINTKSPYVVMNPSKTIDANYLLTGDGIDSTAITNIITEFGDTTKKKRYQQAGYGITDVRGSFWNSTASSVNTDVVSTFQYELGDTITGKSYDFPLLVINDTTTADTVVNNYLRLLTNTNLDFSNNVSNQTYGSINGDITVGTVTIKKCTYDSASGSYTLGDNACLTISNGAFAIRKDSSNKEQYDTAVEGGQFTLIDVAFKDPTVSSNQKVAYHLYVPVIVKKLLEYNFDISSISGSTYDQTLYTGNRGNNVVENLGAPVTMEFEYKYLRNAAEWEAESDTAYSLDKYLSFAPQTTALFDNTATKLVLVDINRGGKEYYLDKWSDGYNSETKLLNLQAFKDADGAAFSPVTFSDMLSAQQISGNQNLKEKYYLTIFTDPFDRPVLLDGNGEPILDENGKEKVDTDLVKVIHYSVTSSNIGNAEHPTRRVDCTDQASGSYHYATHLVIGDFYTNSITVSTPSNANENMSNNNKTIMVNLSASIDLVNSGTRRLLRDYLGKSNVTIYQSLLASFEKYNNNSLYDKGLTAIDGYSIDSYTITGQNGAVIPVADRQILRTASFIEFQNNTDISGSLQNGSVTSMVQATLEFNSENARKAQFPYRISGQNTGARVIGYSNISSNKNNTAYSVVSVNDDDINNKMYYVESEERAELQYYADYSNANKQNQLNEQLGINAREIESTQSKSFIQTVGRYDSTGLLNASKAQYLECSLRLYQKQENGSYSEVDIGSYLDQLSVLSGKTPVYSDTATHTYVFNISDVEQFENEQYVYKIPITFNVFTGNQTGFKDTYLYSNYKVELTVALFDHNDSTDTAAPWSDRMGNSTVSDWVIYTNARIYTDLINSAS